MDQWLWAWWWTMVASFSCLCSALHFKPFHAWDSHEHLDMSMHEAAKRVLLSIHTVRLYLQCGVLLFFVSSVFMLLHFASPRKYSDMDIPTSKPLIQEQNWTILAVNGTR